LFVRPLIKAHRLFLLALIEANMAVKESSFSLGSIVQVAVIDLTGLLPRGATQRPLYGVVQTDGSVALQVAVVSGGSGGGGGGPVAPTAAGTTATTANPIQGVTGGVPVNVAITSGGGASNTVAATAAGTTATTANPIQGVTGGVAVNVAITSGGGVSNTVVATAAGTSATTANPVQFVTGGVPFSVTGVFWQTTQPISIATMPALVASTAAIGQVGGKTVSIDVALTVTAAAYATGQIVGGLITFSGALLAAGTGILQSITIKCKSVQTTGFKLYLFKSNPTNSTWTDKTTPAINAADIPYLTAVRTLASPDSSLGTHTLYVDDGIGKVIAPGATTMYGILFATGAPTFASTSDVIVSIGILQD
jgi:hypothetical protein